VPHCPPVTYIRCDLSSFASVQDAAREFCRREQRLDILFLNAGIMASPHSVTEDGYEVQLGVNYMGHALLFMSLLPRLLATAKRDKTGVYNDVRVVVLSSIGHIYTPRHGIAFSELKGKMEHYSAMCRYGQSKLANILFVVEAARRFLELTIVAVHPGLVRTDLYRTVYKGWFGDLFGPIAGYVAPWTPVFVSAMEGAKGQLWAASVQTGQDVGMVWSGEYYTPVGVRGQGTALSCDRDLTCCLWEWMEEEFVKWEQV